MTPYNGALTREQFLFREMRIVAQLYQQGLSESDIIERVFSENLFQYPTERESKGKCKCVLKRLSFIVHSPGLVGVLAEGTVSEAKQVALVAMMCQSQLLADFMIEVVGEKYRLLDMTLTAKDLNLFFAHLGEKDEKVAGWSPATVKKIKYVLTNVLRENGYMEGVRSETLYPVFISDSLEVSLKEAGLQRYLAAFYRVD